MHWIVAVPDYAAGSQAQRQVTYGFAGIDHSRTCSCGSAPRCCADARVCDLRAALGAGHNVAATVVRVVALGAVLVSYPWWWSQAAAAVNQLTHRARAAPGQPRI